MINLLFGLNDLEFCNHKGWVQNNKLGSEATLRGQYQRNNAPVRKKTTTKSKATLFGKKFTKERTNIQFTSWSFFLARNLFI